MYVSFCIIGRLDLGESNVRKTYLDKEKLKDFRQEVREDSGKGFFEE